MPSKTKSRTPKSSIPAPFTAAPENLQKLLSTFNKSSVYITHVDNHPAWFKKRVFLVPVCLNLAISAFLLWRAYVAVPWYFSLLMSFLGNHNETTIFYATTPWGTMISGILKRAVVFIFDYILYAVIGPWPYSFFLEDPGNPVFWRYKIGFRNEEIYIRESRGWGASDLLGEAEGSTGKAGEDSPFFKTRILPAVEARRLREKTGYMLMDKDYDLAFAQMTYATVLLDKKEIELDMLRKSVFVWFGSEDKGQWCVWDCWKLDEGSESEAREKIILFKDRLTAMGKENLFFRWVELVQYESNSPGGFTEEKQISTAKQAKKMFEDQGVDFENFIKEIGGLDGMPGMGQPTK